MDILTRLTWSPRPVAGLFLLLALALAPMGSLPADEPARLATRPSIVIILADDLGWGDLSCYGNNEPATPHLDRMAAQGIRFTQAYVASPICSPSRCGIITGQFPARWRITSYLQTRAGNRACEMADFLDSQAPSLPRILQAAGYATAHIGKWHLGGGRDVTTAPPFSAYGYDLGLGTYESPEPAAALGLRTTPWSDDREPQQVPRSDRTRWMVDQTIGFLSAHPDQPCFVNLWLDDTHTPFSPSPVQLEAIDAGREETPELRYRAVLFEMDRQLGRLMDAVKGTHTLLIFLGDNGPLPAFASRAGGLRGSKLSLYEGGIRVPLIAWWADAPTGGTVNDRTVLATVDLLPTLATLTSAPLPPGYTPDGEDLSPALRGEKPTRTRTLLWEYGRNETSFVYPPEPSHRSPNVAIREADWKLLVNTDGTRAELYDIAADPAETRNQADPQPRITRRLTEAALSWRRSMP